MQIAAPNRRFNLLLLAVVGLNFLPHMLEQSLAIFLIPLICLIWRLGYEYQRLRLPNFWVKALLVGLSLGFIFLLYRDLLASTAVQAILLCGAALKMLDNVSYRDAMVLLFVNFMLLMSAFLIDQSLWISIFAFFDLVVISALLFQLHKAKDLQFNLWAMLKLGLKLSFMIFPFLILMFFVFPRFSLGIFPQQSRAQNSSGFSEHLEPGDIDQLVLDDSPAFRVYFQEGSIPEPRQMYWRGISLNKTEGLKWSGLPRFVSRHEKQSGGGGETRIPYEVVLEPGYGRWLFLLERERSLKFSDPRYQRGLEWARDGSYRLAKPVSQSFIYQAESVMESQPEEIDLETYLQLPESVDAKLVALAAELSEGKKEVEIFSRKAKEYFASQFRYSLDLRGKKAKDLQDFLFVQKLGFCEHFAAAYAFLARLSGIPSRVVAGFQGASKHPLGNYYLVSNRDAHAWVEIYDQQSQKWLRVDPTAFVAPLRLELGGQLFYSVRDTEAANWRDAESFLARARANIWQNYWRQLRLSLDIISERWTYFLLSYDFRRQQSLLKNLGLGVSSRAELLWMTVIGGILCFLLFRYFLRRRLRLTKSPAQRRLQKHLQYFRRQGLVKRSAQGYLDFCDEAAATQPSVRSLWLDYRKQLAHNLYAKPSDPNQAFQGWQQAFEKLKKQGFAKKTSQE